MNPDEIVGSPTERQIWLAPDWSKRGSTAASAGPGATQVFTRTVTYRDGRVITYVLDENHNPITHQTLSEDTDQTLKDAWDKAKTQANAQAGVTKPTNVYVGTNPSTGKPTQVSEWPDGHKSYDDTQVPASAATQNVVVTTEGTPDPSKPDGWDNTRPRKVTRAVNPDGSPGRVISSVELSGADLTAWRAEQQANRPTSKEIDVPNRPGWKQIIAVQDGNETSKYRGPDGQVVDSLPEQPKSGEQRDPVPNRPGWTSIARSKVENGRTVQATTFIGPGTNGQEVDTLPPVDQEESGSYRKNPETGQLEHVIKTVTPSGTSTTYKPVLPSERTQIGIKTETKGGKTTKITTWQLPDGSTTTTTDSEETITAPYPAGTPTFRPDWQKPGMGAYDYASEVRKFQRENPGSLSDAQLKDLLGEASAQAKAEAERVNTILGVQQNINSTESGERNTDVSAQTARRNQAVSIANQAASTADSLRGYAKHGSDTAGKAQIAQMVLGTALAQIMGGNNVERTKLSPMMEQIRGQTLPGAEITPSSAPTAAQLQSGFNPMQAAQTEADRQQAMAAQAGQAGPPPPLGQGQDLSTPPSGGQSPLAPLGPAFRPPPQIPGQSPIDPATGQPIAMGSGAFDGISLFNHL